LGARHDQALQAKIDQLRLEMAELRASRERLVLAADADRRRLERNLHESVRQHLVALAINLQRAAMSVDADPAAAGALLQEMRDDVQRALDETAALAQRIYPAQLDARGLAATLRSAAMSAGIPASVEVQGSADLPPEVAAGLYLCCLEALEQVRPGARAAVAVRHEEGAIAFEVIEDGAGVEEARSEGDLEPLRDRVEALGGRLTVPYGPGLHVVGSIPLPR